VAVSLRIFFVPYLCQLCRHNVGQALRFDIAFL